MPQLDNLITTIIENGEKTAREIIENAEREANEFILAEVEKSEIEKELLIDKAKVSAAQEKDALIHNKRLTIRDDILQAKRRMIDMVLIKALDIVSQMTKEEFEEYIEKTLITSHENKKGTLIVPKQFSDIDIQAISNITNTDLTIDSSKNVSNGFVFISDGVEYNNTFDGLLEYYRDDLELFIANELFKEV